MVVLEKSLVTALNAKSTGSGDITVVLSHGYGVDQSIWENILPDLAQRCRVVVFDWNFLAVLAKSTDHGNSCYSTYEAFSDDLVALMDEMDLKNVVFVGHSMAGMIGCIAAVKRPDLFRRLVPLGASPRYLNSEGYKGGFEMQDVDNLLSAIETDFHSWAQSFARLAVGGSDPGPAEKFGQCLQRMRPDVALELAKVVFWSDLRDVLDDVEVPCTIITGANDIVVPMPVSHYMQTRIRGGASLEVLDFDGHFPQLTACRSLLDALDRILS
uniref:Sigma factor sigB regulation protein rsbQ n=1 Tax=Anthurium amnicola TaxID=1678845 RepID=A0A1D1XRA6_9ARAE